MHNIPVDGLLDGTRVGALDDGVAVGDFEGV